MDASYEIFKLRQSEVGKVTASKHQPTSAYSISLEVGFVKTDTLSGLLVAPDVCKIIFCSTLILLRHKNATNIPCQSLCFIKKARKQTRTL